MTTAWPKVSLGETCTFQNGGTPSRTVAAYFDGEIPWLTGADIEGSSAGACRTFLTDAGIKESPACVVPEGTILLVTRTGVGKVAIANRALSFSQDITALTPDPTQLDRRYLLRFLQTEADRFKAESRGATIQGVTREVVASTKIPLPPLDEQRRIAAILDKADEVRSKRKAALETLETLSQAIFIDMFGDPVANPKRWPQVEISSLVNSVETWNPKSDLGREFTYIDVSSVDRYSKTVTGATSLECSSAPSRAKQLVRDGDVLVSTVRPNLNGVALITSELNGATASTGFTVLRPKQGVLASQYLFEWVKSPVFIERLMRQATGASYPAVSDRIIKSETLLLPSIDAQLEFTSRMTHVSKFAMTARLQAMAAENLYSSIQQRAFQGTL